MKQNFSATNPTPGDLDTTSIRVLRSLRFPFRVPVSGSSMRPLLRDGDLVVVHPLIDASPQSISAGSLILFERKGQAVVHRLVGWRRGQALEKGDRARVASQLDPGAILGVIHARIRGGVETRMVIPWWYRVKVWIGAEKWRSVTVTGNRR